MCLNLQTFISKNIHLIAQLWGLSCFYYEYKICILSFSSLLTIILIHFMSIFMSLSLFIYEKLAMLENPICQT